MKCWVITLIVFLSLVSAYRLNAAAPEAPADKNGKPAKASQAPPRASDTPKGKEEEKRTPEAKQPMGEKSSAEVKPSETEKPSAGTKHEDTAADKKGDSSPQNKTEQPNEAGAAEPNKEGEPVPAGEKSETPPEEAASPAVGATTGETVTSPTAGQQTTISAPVAPAPRTPAPNRTARSTPSSPPSAPPSSTPVTPPAPAAAADPKERVRYVTVEAAPEPQTWQEKAIATGKLAVVLGVLFLALPFIVNRTISNVERRYYLRKYSQYALGVILAVGLLLIWVERTRDLTVAIGMMGAGIAFALQEVIGSFAGWLTLITSRSMQVGDRVEMGGIKGDVIDIGVLRTTLMEIGAWMTGDHYTGRIVLVSNASIFKEPLFNYTKDFDLIWDEVKLTVPHNTDWKRARQILQEAGEQHAAQFIERGRAAVQRMGKRYMFQHERLEPSVVIVPTTTGALEVILRYLAEPKRRRQTKDDIVSTALERFRAEGIALYTSGTTVNVITNGAHEESGQ